MGFALKYLRGKVGEEINEKNKMLPIIEAG